MGNRVVRGVRVMSAAGLSMLAGGLCASPCLAQVGRAGMDAGAGANAGIDVGERVAWKTMLAMPAEVMAGEAWVRPERYGSFALNTPAMRAALAQAPMEFSPEAQNPAIVEIPLPDGTLGLFHCVESPVMEAELQAKFPEIRTYLVWSVTDRSINGRIDLTPAGFHAMIFTPETGTFFVDPVTRDDATHHVSYFREDLKSFKQWQCHFDADENLAEFLPDAAQGAGGWSAGATEGSGTELRTYRLAMACTGEYAAYHDGPDNVPTVAEALAAVTTTTNRVVGVYEREVSVRMVLVANNDLLMYLNASTDPYTNTNGVTMLGQNQTTCNSVIGSANYDVGHVVSTGGGGVASLGVICSSNKARGVTGLDAPVGDPFDIDYVAHELGHQFGGNHTFNGNDSNCNANRNASTAYEPGSGSTIMAYAGICAPNNLQNNSDAYFHTVSYDEIRAHITSGTGNNCDVPTSTGNSIPSVEAGPSYTIPISTQFVLTATGSDPDGDSLTFNWEQRNLGAATAISANDNGSSPIFRSYTGTADGKRTFPRTTTPSTTTLVAGDRYPITNRTMTFRATARDNRAGGGGVESDTTTVTSTTSAGPFAVTSPNTSLAWAGGSTQTVTWNVANTNIAPVNTANVRILLSTDSGFTFPTVLVASTPNDGSESVVIPNPAFNSTTNRIRIEAVGNIYFDISNVNFTITATAAPAAPTNVIATPGSICPGGSSTLSGSVTAGNTIDWYTGGCGTTLVGSGLSLPVSPAGTTTYFARARNTTTNAVSATCTQVSVTVNPVATPASSASVDRSGFCAGDTGTITLSAVGGSGTTLNWYSGECGGTFVGSGNGLVINSPTAPTTYFARWSTACGDSDCVSVDVAVNVSDVNLDGASDFGDFLQFFNCFDAFEPCADIDGIEGVDFGDFLTFFNGFDAGC